MADHVESRIDRVERNLEKLVGVVESLAAIQERNEESLRRQAEAGDQRFRRIETAQLETTEKLNALIQVADEWIRRGPQRGA